MSQIILGVYGILMIVGSFFGAKAGSKVSLVMGLLSGSLVFVGLWMAQSDVKSGYGFLSALTVLLSVTFLVRLLKTKKFMPSGMLLILSLIAAVCSLTTLF